MVQDIHLQVNFSQTAEVGRVQHASSQQIVAHQEAIANKMETQAKREETEVLTTRGPEARGLGRKTSAWWKRKRKEGAEEDDDLAIAQMTDPIRGKIIDVWR